MVDLKVLKVNQEAQEHKALMDSKEQLDRPDLKVSRVLQDLVFKVFKDQLVSKEHQDKLVHKEQQARQEVLIHYHFIQVVYKEQQCSLLLLKADQVRDHYMQQLLLTQVDNKTSSIPLMTTN